MIIRNFLLFIAGLLLFANAFASIDSSDSDSMQTLLSRIEVLEQSVLNLKKEIAQLKSVERVSSNHTEVELDNTSSDVFDSVISKKVEVAKGSHFAEKVAVSKQGAVNEDKKVYDLALASLKDNKLKEAEEKFAEFLKLYPKSSLQSNVYFWYGETFFRRNLFDAAAINYLKGYKQFPKGAKASDSLLKLSLCLGELNKKKDACQMLGRLESEFPSRPSASIKRAADAKIKFGCKP